METRDDMYEVEAALNNLAMLKIAYDEGLPSKLFQGNEIYADYEVEHEHWDIFLKVLYHKFEIVEEFFPYGDDENIASKKYWQEITGYGQCYDSTAVIVLMDDRIRPFIPCSIGGWQAQSHWYTAFGEIQHIDKGIVFIFDEEEGPLDTVEALLTILGVLKDSERREKEYAMAI